MRLSRLAALVAATALAVAACDDGSRATAEGSPSTAEGDTISLSYYSVRDQAAGGAEAYRLLVPDGWNVSGSGVSWNIGFRSGGVSAELQVTDPAVARGFGYIPSLPRYWIEPPLFGFPEGSVYGILGSIATRPLTATEYISLVVIPENFPPGTTVIGSQQLPELARAVAEANELQSVDAARTRILFSNGATDVEAHVYAWIRYDVLDTTTLWSPVGTPAGLYVVFAPAGRLDEESSLLNSLALSSILNADWVEYVNLVEELRISGNQRIQRQMDQLIQTLRETNDAIFDFTSEGYRQRQEINDRIYQNYTETILDIETYNDPGVGAIELPGGFSEVWATGTGDWILSNDPLFDPNLNSQLDWELIRPTD